MSDIRIAGIVEESIVDGPGIRYTVFTQGCPHNCPGCHNPETHDFTKGRLESIDKIVSDIGENPLLSGITISGGEPFVQADKVLELVKKVKEKYKLSVMIYSGYTYEELRDKQDKNIDELLNICDILTDGRFIEKLKDYELTYRGSSNQRVIDLKKTRENNKVVLYDLKKTSVYG